MKRNKLFTSIIITFLTFAMSLGLKAQGFLKADGKKIVNGNNQEVILRGMGLGGWMVQEGYMMKTAGFLGTQHELKNAITTLIGQNGMEAFYDAWLKNYVTEADVDSMAAWGFNSIRLPMHYNLYTLPIEQEPVTGEQTWLQKGFELTDSLLKWCKKNEMYLILDLHAAPGGQGTNADISDYDPSKPSLWESEENKAKTVALWKKLAERYVNEEWIGGYDLINETNWEMSENVPLKEIYLEITDSIRKIDNNHIIFIEGNWFANDFTGLTPPWDNNMVYSFHKYWTNNDQASIQWVLDIRETHNTPLWLGESGENSNTWFNECISLAEDHHIGWAWWPYKKIEDIAGPFSIVKTAEYETLLKYWNPDEITPKPTTQYATEALMQLAENLKTENCEFHPDVVDAMFRQINSTETKPYSANNIPGIVYAPNFDMGTNNQAYYDKVVANYHLNSGSFTAWNSGWSYRNDGVDIEESDDITNSNGYNVGHIEDEEWMLYTVDIDKTAVYNVNVRTASENSDGSFYFQEDGADICSPVSVASSGGWQTWQTTNVSNIILSEGTHKLKFNAAKGGFNLGSFEFIEVGETVDLPTEFISAHTHEDGYTIKLNINKPLSAAFPDNPINDFTVSINGTDVEVTNIEPDVTSPKIINITISYLMKFGNKILLSNSGNQVNASDGTGLQLFAGKEVVNNLPQRHSIPGRIQAEEYFFNNGFSEENTNDTGGGLNVGWTNVGDYLDYYISVDERGVYDVSYRIAAENTTGQIELLLIGEETKSLHTIDLPVTGGWQTWETVAKSVEIPAGQYVLRVLVKKTEFNLNWLEFNLVSGVNDIDIEKNKYQLYPNPANKYVYVRSEKNANNFLDFRIINSAGQCIKYGKTKLNEAICISGFHNGVYYFNIYNAKKVHTHKLIVN